jgi:molecular chaperone GrpE
MHGGFAGSAGEETLSFSIQPASGMSRKGRKNILAGLKKIAKVFSVDEFEIDARPVEVIDFAQMRQEQEVESADEAASGTTTDLPATAPAPALDLFSSLSEILARQSQLEQQLARELKPAGAQDDEFSRFARQIVTYLDSMDRIIEYGKQHEAGSEISGWLQSVETAHQRFLKLLEQHNLQVLNCRGQEVDFGMHDVIEYRRTLEYPHNTVIEEINKGVVFRGQVLRDAKVVVACNDRDDDDATIGDRG